MMATEKRLIDGNVLIEKLQEAVAHKGMGAAIAGILIRYIEKLPTVDAVEVVHGRWEFSHTTTVDKFAVVKCSNCGHEAFAIANYVKEGHYCPNCGAKMDGDGNG